MIISTVVSVAISLIWLKSAFKDLVRD